jgi:hypothetical protein
VSSSKRRFVRTTESVRIGRSLPNLRRRLDRDGSDQLWVRDITYIRILSCFNYLAAILDVWSRGGSQVSGDPADRCGSRWPRSGRRSKASSSRPVGVQHFALRCLRGEGEIETQFTL